jgi:predicted DNA-binding transcriptional regulator YafY
MIEDSVRQSYDEGRVLRILYQTANESQRTTVREIEVYAFDETYIDAYCRLRKEKRTFRVDRIKDALLLEDRFDLDSEVEHQIKVAGLSKQAHECQRPCCRPGTTPISTFQPKPFKDEPQPRQWFRPILRVLGIVE